MNIQTFEAKCSNCKTVFSHPSLGDFSYGSFIFNTTDGKNFVYCDALSDDAKMVSNYLPSKLKPNDFQFLLASLADQIFDSQLTNKLNCPNCSSINLEYWHGNKIDEIDIKTVTFNAFLSLDNSSKKIKVQEILNAIA